MLRNIRKSWTSPITYLVLQILPSVLSNTHQYEIILKAEGLLQFGKTKLEQTMFSLLSSSYYTTQEPWASCPAGLMTPWAVDPIFSYGLPPLSTTSIKHAGLPLLWFCPIHQFVCALKRRSSGRMDSVMSGIVKEKVWHKAKSSCLSTEQLLWWQRRQNSKEHREETDTLLQSEEG